MKYTRTYKQLQVVHNDVLECLFVVGLFGGMVVLGGLIR
jgi:hypothetical protein